MFRRFFTVSSNDAFKSARLKIDRASQHIADVSAMLAEKRPFRYILETDAKVGRRSTYAERDEDVLDDLALRCGDAIQNLRSAIDHAYYAVVSPYASKPKEKKDVQFPFSKTAARLEEACKKRLSHKVGLEFHAAIMALKPHDETGGNKLLYFMSAINNPDKHTSLIPVGYHLKVVVGDVRKKVPDFLPGVTDDSSISVSQNGRDFGWPCKPFTLNDWIVCRVPANGILKQEINVAIDVCFEIQSDGGMMLTVPTLYQFVDVAKQVVSVIARFG